MDSSEASEQRAGMQTSPGETVAGDHDQSAVNSFKNVSVSLGESKCLIVVF